jgi:hypothetical protein
MEGKKDKVYRIVENNFYQRGEICKDHTSYHVEVQKRFLWRKYWTSIKEPSYDHSRKIEFMRIEDAQKLIEKLKSAERINGWSKKVVGGDPTFEKI